MDVQPDVTVIGPGAGGDSAGYGLLSDILAIHNLKVKRRIQRQEANRHHA
jgi:homoserine dehydrogenase